MALPKCLICNKQLSKYSAKRCKSHAHVGSLSYNWKGGKFRNNNCLDCNKKIDRRSKRCKSCGQKNRDPKTRLIIKGKDNPMFGRHLSLETKLKISESKKGTKLTDATKRKMGIATIKKWNNEEYRKKVLGKRLMSNLEIKVQKVIDKYSLPYKFVGNGKFFIERKNPDFININGEKKAVEIYWDRHKEQFTKGGLEGWKKERIKIFNEYGWEVIFIEGTNLNEKIILNKLKGGY